MDSDITPDAELDCVGLYCPMPIAQQKRTVSDGQREQVMRF